MPDTGRRARLREGAGAVVQYALLFGFAGVAAAISAHGLTGFARVNMGLPGPWPYLLWGALDGAAGLCAVLAMRRAARGEPGLAPRLAVWGLVAASAVFNWAHAPDNPGARQAFALMPMIAAVLFEFSLRETRHAARRPGRRLTGPGWLRPAERIRIQARLSADAGLDAQDAARRVRAESAARWLHTLRLALAVQDQAARPSPGLARRVRRAERHAQAALTRARFADPACAASVLRQVQVLTLTSTLARLDYTSAAGSHALLASLITTPADCAPARSRGGAQEADATAAAHGSDGNGQEGLNGWDASHGLAALNGHSLPQADAVPEPPSCGGASSAAPPQPPAGFPAGNGRGDHALVEAAARMVAQASADGERLSQAALARRLRAEGFHIANERLRWLASSSGLPPWGAEQTR